MNNGVNENQENNSLLAPMAGVKIAPVMESNSTPPVVASEPTMVNAEPVIANPQPTVVEPTPVMVNTQPTVVEPTPVIANATPLPQEKVVTPQQTVIPSPPITSPAPEKTKKKINLVPILLLFVLLLGGYILFSMKMHNDQIRSIQYNCTPVPTQEEKELPLESTLVQELYKKVATTIREDYALPEFNNQMKLYLAYRQILETDKYDTTCTQFSIISMEPYVCEGITNFTPKGFKEETLQLEMKKLYGENTQIPFENIQLGSSCIGGYQYIPARKEFVEGYCNQKTAVSFKATKELVNAVSYENTIVLTENVKYRGSEGMELPSYLKSGEYRYIFRLDKNYHYVFVNKEYVEKY